MRPNDPITSFTRTAEQQGLRRPVVTYCLFRSSGSEAGRLVISKGGYRAAYASADLRDSFRIRLNFWTYRWTHEEDGREFARMRMIFRRSVVFADGATYRIDIRRRNLLFNRDPDAPAQVVTFSSQDRPVLTLRNTERPRLFHNELTMPMAGTIETDLTDEAIIAGLLLYFQTKLAMRRAAAAS